MTRRDFFLKWLFYGTATLLLIALQHLVLNHLEIRGVHPYILPLLAIMPAILENRQESLFFAVLLGVVFDLTAAAPLPIFYAPVFLAVTALTSLISGRAILSGYLCALLCGLLTMVITGLCYILALSFSGGLPAFSAFSLMGWELLLSLPAAPLIFPIYQKIYRRIRNE